MLLKRLSTEVTHRTRKYILFNHWIMHPVARVSTIPTSVRRFLHILVKFYLACYMNVHSTEAACKSFHKRQLSKRQNTVNNKRKMHISAAEQFLRHGHDVSLLRTAQCSTCRGAAAHSHCNLPFKNQNSFSDTLQCTHCSAGGYSRTVGADHSWPHHVT
jgi:hypothetical protein